MNIAVTEEQVLNVIETHFYVPEVVMRYSALQYAYFDLSVFKLERKIHSWCLHIVSTEAAPTGEETLSGFVNS